MELVASAALTPGECMWGGASTDLVDTGREIPRREGRAYISRATAIEIGMAAGCASPVIVQALEEQLRDADNRADEAENLLIDAKELLAEAEVLRTSFAYTLQQGVVIDMKKGTVGLRPRPGSPKGDINKPIVLDETPVGG